MKEINYFVSAQRPWPGLASYTLNDAKFFIGRSQEIHDLERQILSESLLCLYGPSGVGKSSLLQAGIAHRMETHGFFPVFIRLEHQNKNLNYTSQIIQAVKESLKQYNVETEELAESVFNEKESLWEFFHRIVFWDSRNKLVKPLLIIDQFEEIFTLSDFGKNAKDFITELGELAENVVPEEIQSHLRNTNQKLKIPNEAQNYRLIVSLREDFLAKLEMVTQKIPAFRKNRFPVKALNGEQAIEIINIAGENIVDEGVDLAIIETISLAGVKGNDEIDLSEIIVEPALISLFCRELNERRISTNQPKITRTQVKEQGENILINFYDSCFRLVADETEYLIEENLLTEPGYRKPVPLEDMVALGIPLQDIEKLINDRLLRKEDRYGILWVEYSHDILTKIAIVKRENRRSEQELKKAREQSEKLIFEQKVQNRKAKIQKTIIASLLFVLIAGGFAVYYCWFMPHDYYYAQMIKRNGFFEGLNSLSKEQASHCKCYFKLSRKGIFGYYHHIEALNGLHKLTTDHNMSTYLVNKYDDEDKNVFSENKEKLKTVCQWEFVANDAGEIVSEMAFDEDKKLIFGFIHTNTYVTPTGKQSICQFTDTYGLPFKQRTNGADYLRISYDKRGFEVKTEYFDKEGNPKPNMNDAYGEINEYSSMGLLTLNASIDQFGNYMTDKAGNTGQRIEYDQFNNAIKTISFDKNGEICEAKIGYAIVKYEYDKFGNQISYSYFDDSEKPTCDTSNVHGTRVHYNENGFITKLENLSLDGESLVNSKPFSIAVQKMNYDAFGNRISWEKFDKNLSQDSFTDTVKWELEFNEKGDLISEKQFISNNKTLKCSYEYKTYKNNEGLDTLRYWFNLNDSIQETYVRQKFDSLDNMVYWGYFDKSITPLMYADEDDYYHSSETKIVFSDTITHKKSYYDISGNRIENRDGTAEEVIKYYNGNEIERGYYDLQGNIIKYYRYAYNNEKIRISQQYIGISGLPYRGDKDAMYYSAKIVMNLQNDNYSEFVGFNEFDEPSYIEAKNLVYHKQILPTKEFFDEKGQKIESMTEYYNSLSQVVSLSLRSKDSPAYEVGIKDGDILIRYNSWKYGINVGFKGLVDELAASRDENKTIEIIRFPECKIHSFELPEGMSGINLNSVRYTPKELERLIGIINQNKD